MKLAVNTGDVRRMILEDFIMGAGPNIGNGLGPDSYEGLGTDMYNGMGGGISRLFGAMPYGIATNPRLARSYRLWRMGAVFRLVLLLFVGLPCACLLLFYGLGTLGDAFGRLEPMVGTPLRPYLRWLHDVLVILRDVVAPYVDMSRETLQGVVNWLRSLAGAPPEGV